MAMPERLDDFLRDSTADTSLKIRSVLVIAYVTTSLTTLNMTGFEISELVTDAPRGEVIKTKIEKYFPEASKIPGSGYILKLLPSYGGDWEQYYEIRMEWKK